MIYLDNNATTSVAPEVIQAMEPFWRGKYGNPSSLHLAGQAARHAVEQARERLARVIGARPREIVFTSGGTEANNLAILGTLAARSGKRHIVVSSVEHLSIHDLCRRLEEQGYRISYVAVDASGGLDAGGFASALGPDTAVASIMQANNETGVVFPIEEIAAIAGSRGVPLHVDAVQSLGKMEIDVGRLGANLMSFSSHKIHGPKGGGALYVGRGVRLRGLLVGGHQERDLRPGTENVPAIVGFAAAAELCARQLADGAMSRVADLRDRLESGILERVPCAAVIGSRRNRVPSTTCIGFECLQAEAILVALSEAGLCASSGSACSSGSLEPSHVLRAMGVDGNLAHGAVRFSLSHETTEAEVDQALEIIPQVVGRLAALGVSVG